MRIGVIGAGGRGGPIASRAKTHGKVDMTAVCDNNQVRLDMAKKSVEAIMQHPVKTYLDYKELLAQDDLDAVVITTPDFLHHPMATAAFKAGKHVFLEKPVGINFRETCEILAAAREAGKTIEIGYVLRYAPFYMAIKDALDQGKIGRPLFCEWHEFYSGGAGVFNRGWWRLKKNTGGLIPQKICHDFDLMYWFFGRPARVASFGGRIEYNPGNWPSDAKLCRDCKHHCPYFHDASHDQKYGIKAEKLDGLQSDMCLYNGDSDQIDNAAIIVQFESGMSLVMSMHFFPSHAQDGRYIRVNGSKYEMTGRLEQGTLRFDPRFGEGDSQSFGINVGDFGGHGGGDEVQMDAFFDAVLAGREAKAGMESAYWSSTLTFAANDALNQGKIIDIAKFIKQVPFTL